MDKFKIEPRRFVVMTFALIFLMAMTFAPPVKGWHSEAKGVDYKTGVGDAPALVGVSGFKVFTDGKEVFVEWSMGEDPNNLGFNIYRELDGTKELINKTPIAGSSIKTIVNLRGIGENYFWRDKSFNPRDVYFLEQIDLNGRKQLHGPVFPTKASRFRGRNVFSTRVNSPSLAEVTKVDNPSSQKEFVRSRPSSSSSEKQSLSVTSVETTQWEIAGQYAPKISVSEEGWYRVPSIELNNVKFDTSENRTNWQLYDSGQEVPIVVNSDGSISFYGKGLDTPTTDTRVYYLIMGEGPGLRLSTVDGGGASGAPVAPNFENIVERKDRSIYISAIFNGDEENWFGPLVTNSVQTIQEIDINGVDTSGQATLRVRLQGLTLVPHQVNVRINDFDLGAVSFNGKENISFDFDVSANLINEGINQIKIQSIGQSNDICLVDSVRLTYSRRFEAVDEKLRFRVPAGQAVEFGGFTQNDVSLYEINSNGHVDRKVIASVEDSGGTRTYDLAPANYDREMFAIAESTAGQVDSVDRNIPSSWNKSTNEADFVIIVPFEFYKYGEGVAFQRNSAGLQTKVVYMEDLYDEFSFGRHAPEAIRGFLERATTTWTVRPRYALLIGDSSFDPRNYLGQTYLDLVPTKLVDTQYLETSSDSWLADFDDDGIEDIGLGRWPVSTSDDVELLYLKWLQYNWQQPRTVRSNVLVADTGFEYYNNLLAADLPSDVELIEIERSGMSVSEMHQAIMTSLNANPQIVTYTGHGTTGAWAHSSIFGSSDAAGLGNNELSIYLLMTCLNGLTHGAYNTSIAEELLKSPSGGASHVWASSGTTFPNTQFEMSETITDLIFNGSPEMKIGDMIITAKQATQDLDVRRTWQLSGDPTAVVK